MHSTNYIMSPGELLMATEIASTVATIATAVFLGFILLGALFGLRRGLLRQGLHLGVTLVVAVVAFISVKSFCGSILTELSSMTTEDLLGYIELQLAAQGQTMPPDAYEGMPVVLRDINLSGVGLVLSLVINTILAPVLFFLVFIIIRFVAKIITVIVTRFIPRKREFIQKIFGAIAGAIEGAVVAAIIILPIVMLVNVTGDIAGVINKNTPMEDEIDDEYAEEVVEHMNEVVHVYDKISAPLSESFVVKTVSSLGGEAALKGFATIEFEGAKTDLRNDLKNILGLAYKIAMFGVVEIDPTDGLSHYEREYISGIVDNVDDSTVVSNVLYTALRVYVSVGLEYVDEETLAEEPAVAVLMDLVMNKTSASTLGDNLNTIKNIFFIVSDDIIPAASVGGDAYEALFTPDENGETVLDKIVAELEKNENTAHLPDMLVELAMREMMGGATESEEYEAVKDVFSDIVKIETEGKEKEEVKDEVKDVFVELFESQDLVVGGEDADVSEEDLDRVADFLAEELMNGNIDIPVDENGQISDLDLLELIMKYQEQFNGNIEDLPVPEE